MLKATLGHLEEISMNSLIVSVDVQKHTYIVHTQANSSASVYHVLKYACF